LLFITGCASLQNGHPSDPLESINRGIYEFNQKFDKAVGKPIAKGYRYVTPTAVDLGITNFFHNLSDVPSIANNLLQLKPTQALTDLGRICINTTLGIFGLFDVASDMGIPNYKEDLGQTLGYWGVGDTPYLMLPFMGPTTLRDLVGGVGDGQLDPLKDASKETSYALDILAAIDARADLLEALDALDEAAVDRYAFQRDIFLQSRSMEVMDGSDNEDDDPFDDTLLFEDEDPSPQGSE
jgi:phospholipid-binding lipoprotein MlaA